MDGATTLATVPLSGSQAAFTTSALSVGTHPVTATYNGDGSNNPSTSGPVNQVVNPVVSTTTLVSSQNPSTFGQVVTFTATVTGSTPTGTVTFKDGSTTLATVALNGSGQAAFTTSSLNVSTHAIAAAYSGDANNAPSSASLNQVVNPGGSSTAVVSSQNPSTLGQAVTFTAIVTGSNPTGTVTFKDGATTLATVTLNGGQAAFTSSTLSVGTHPITATYNGDATNATSTSAPFNQVVGQGATTTALQSSQNPSAIGQAVTFTATVTPSNPTGSVTFKDGANSLATVPLNGSGQATFTTSALSAGTHSISATYNGDANNLPSISAPLNQVVNQAATSTALQSSQNPSAVGQAVTFTATVTGSNPTGTVMFKDGASTLATVPLNGSGQATFTTSALTAGTHVITATYNGDANNAPSTSAPLNQVVNQGATTTSLQSSQNPSAFGQPVTFTATVTPTGGTGTPTGTVTFKDGATVIGTGTLNAAAQATITTSSLSVGSHSITAVYGGNAIFAGSTSAPLIQAVNVPADSVRLRGLQLAVTKIEAQSSGQAIAGAIDSAISDGFAANCTPITPSEMGLRFNLTAIATCESGTPGESGRRLGFAGEPQERGTVRERVGDAFSALGYARRDPVYKAAAAAPVAPAPDWLAWAEVRGTGWNTGIQTGDIRGGQTNALLGLSRKLSPDLLIGVFGGYEHFDYTSQLLLGRLKGDGWTVGTYLGWRFLPGVRFDAGLARSGITYDGIAGTALTSFPGQRWLATAALVGNYKTLYRLEIEPSVRVYALWEHNNAYVDSLGIAQTERNFSTGRASAGTKVTYPWLWSSTLTVAPYAGLYADYYFNRDDAAPPSGPLLLPTEFVHGFSARVTSGIALAIAGGGNLAVGGELGGLGSDFKVWSVRGRAAVPF
jgi:hypothetical protein